MSTVLERERLERAHDAPPMRHIVWSEGHPLEKRAENGQPITFCGIEIPYGKDDRGPASDVDCVVCHDEWVKLGCP